MSTPIIQIKNLMKTYKIGGETVHALNNVSLEIKKGEFLAIIGPSGSGKSTLMNMLGCLDRPDSGEYLLEGKNIGKMNDNQLASIRNQKIGFIFQNFNLLTKLTALENVELPLLYAGVSAKIRRETAMESLKKVGLADRAAHLPTQLSGGQQQRVAIARALAANPSILLADEPTGALDSRTSKEIMEIMQELNEIGNTIILITHDLTIAKQARRMVSIQDGQLQENGGELLGHFAMH
ncbi:ABC transporter ATP-binding protein [Neobacillus fumarioli]|uniref:ABC transporter ATP-binding protein n=1 Tax=Neobacillus fumarioli TaxID=105229 RepID=UPI00082D7C18|nr:ABC transporter ATP-binding protein [Neobacillus fumarioli]